MFRTILSCLVVLVAASFTDAQEASRGRGYKPLHPEKRKAFYEASAAKHGGRLAMLARFQDLPPAFDARTKGWVLPVGDQAQCGSCYLYSTIYGTLTQAFVKAGYGKPDGSFVMAVQFGMDCHDFGGCNGGNGTEVIDWVVQNGWPAEKWVDTAGVSHSDYPAYEARSRSCREVPGAKRWKPSSWGFVSASQNRPATTLEIKTALYNFGALNVSLDAGGQFGNGSGTITSLGTSIDHEIELIAWDDNKDGGAFLLKNQWTTEWGNGGVRWVTYAAARNLVDVFYVSVAPLPPPPPPPPPVPPGPLPPVPPGPVVTQKITLSGFGASDGLYDVLPDGALDLTVRDLLTGKANRKQVFPSTSQEPPLLNSAEPSIRSLMEMMLKEQSKINAEQRDFNEKQKQINQVTIDMMRKMLGEDKKKAEAAPQATPRQEAVSTAKLTSPPVREAIEWWEQHYPMYAPKK